MVKKISAPLETEVHTVTTTSPTHCIRARVCCILLGGAHRYNAGGTAEPQHCEYCEAHVMATTEPLVIHHDEDGKDTQSPSSAYRRVTDGKSQLGAEKPHSDPNR